MSAAEPHVPLSLLDFATVYRGETPRDAFCRSVDLAQKAEELGYTRIWYSEHHNMTSIASSSPAVLIAHIAAKTESIRLGAGGVMLPNHAPLVIAEQYGTLAELHPDRIDLGLGRAPGTDARTVAVTASSAPGWRSRIESSGSVPVGVSPGISAGVSAGEMNSGTVPRSGTSTGASRLPPVSRFGAPASSRTPLNRREVPVSHGCRSARWTSQAARADHTAAHSPASTPVRSTAARVPVSLGRW